MSYPALTAALGTEHAARALGKAFLAQICAVRPIILKHVLPLE